jgi:hypothetical protein
MYAVALLILVAQSSNSAPREDVQVLQTAGLKR